LHARFHSDFGAIVDKVQVTIYTDPAKHAEWLATAREAYDYRNKRLADLTDDKVDEFYFVHAVPVVRAESRLRGQARAPGSVRRIQLARLQGVVQHQPHRPQQAIKLGKLLDPSKGYWEGTNDYAKVDRTAW